MSRQCQENLLIATANGIPHLESFTTGPRALGVTQGLWGAGGRGDLHPWAQLSVKFALRFSTNAVIPSLRSPCEERRGEAGGCGSPAVPPAVGLTPYSQWQRWHKKAASLSSSPLPASSRRLRAREKLGRPPC